MENKDLLILLESQNMEFIKLVNSREYLLGKKILKLVRALKCFKIKEILSSFLNNKKIKKFNVYDFDENVSRCVWKKQLQEGNHQYRGVIYSCITGGYDELLEPKYLPKNVDYVMYLSDARVNLNDTKWKIRSIPDSIKELNDNAMINRYIKFHPYELFDKKYDYAIYIDGNIQVYSDLSYYYTLIDKVSGLAMHRHCLRNCAYKEAATCKIVKKGKPERIDRLIEKYKSLGFPADYGLLECNIIVSDLRNSKSINILREWWNELQDSDSGRDQIILPFILWKNNITVDSVSTLGNNVYRNPKIRKVEHNK